MNKGIENQPVNNIEWVKPEELYANDYNPNHVAPVEMNLLKLSILEDGWTQPIVAKPDGQIVDGFHRWTNGKLKEIAELTGGLVPVVRVNPPQSQQYMSTIRHNRARGAHGINQMASIVQKLIDDEGLDYEEVMARCGMEWEEVDRLYDKAGMTKRGAYEEHGLSQGWVPKDKREKGRF
jgi:ParB-like chromosome segregation protein Spo0J